MKRSLLIAALALVGQTMAMDEYLPISEKTLEIDVGFVRQAFTGSYNDDGEKVDVPDSLSPATSIIPLQIKYGIMAGLDVELMLPYIMHNEDNGDASGLTKPEIGLKYVAAEMGLGGILNIALPFGSDTIVGPNPTMALEIGGIYGKTFGQVNLLAGLSYTLNFEDDDKFKLGNSINVYVKPEFAINEKFGVNAMLNMDFAGESEFDGNGLDDAANIIVLQPGFTAKLNPTVSFEVLAPITLMGKNANAGWGIGALAYFTLPL